MLPTLQLSHAQIALQEPPPIKLKHELQTPKTILLQHPPPIVDRLELTLLVLPPNMLENEALTTFEFPAAEKE
jgi:hypothetical protein